MKKATRERQKDQGPEAGMGATGSPSPAKRAHVELETGRKKARATPNARTSKSITDDMHDYHASSGQSSLINTPGGRSKRRPLRYADSDSDSDEFE